MLISSPSQSHHQQQQRSQCLHSCSSDKESGVLSATPSASSGRGSISSALYVSESSNCGESDSLSRQSSYEDQVFHSTNSSPARSPVKSPMGPKFKLIHEGDIHVCKLNHKHTVISKILSSKFLRRWETHRVYLTSSNIISKTVSRFLILFSYINISLLFISFKSKFLREKNTKITREAVILQFQSIVANRKF
ncbi:hypothetical protein B4U79_02997 [Dinothrombium tinctorium]|uniref:C-Maf-inducing protein PH domain-containing protein n=1 Tax=Dinothrombium tinctorium TaxID=1965070 RepID=A0A3S3PFP2_9ACAR|nr:hypothetical protein B4U79_02997 [Dinothrombium tinctorium]